MRILVIRLSALGDVLTATPTARLLARAGWEVTWLVERHCAELVRGNPWCQTVLEAPRSRDWKRLGQRRGPSWSQVGALRRALRQVPYDVVLDLQGLTKSAAYAALARAPRKLRPADAYERIPGVFTESVPRRLDPRRVTSLYTAMLEPLGIAAEEPADHAMHLQVDAPATAAAEGWLTEQGLAPRGFVALIPGTTRPQKMWPEAHWVALAAELHRRLGLPAAIVGGQDEAQLAARLCASAASPLHDATGRLRLAATGALLRAARLTVAVDTGPMHMAVAVGCPTVAIFGSTPPRWFGDGTPYAALTRAFDCSPCHRRPTCRRYECLEAVRPGDVAARGLELLEDRVD